MLTFLKTYLKNKLKIVTNLLHLFKSGQLKEPWTEFACILIRFLESSSFAGGGEWGGQGGLIM